MRLLAFLFFCAAYLLAPQGVRAEIAGPVAVIDGDTIEVGTTRVRLYGIDAPEQNQTCETPEGTVWPCGAWVTKRVTALFENRTTRCMARDTDRYGRVIATCVSQGEDIAGRLVQDGLAFAYRRYSMKYDAADRDATARRAGLHRGLVQAPEDYRRAKRVASTTTGCRIKGNISRDGARIYHSPGQQHYERTRINERQGERWFCSRGEAEAAGWRAAKR